MFAILQEQYSRSVYPSGIIGINPSGRFIFSKYEGTTSNRVAVSGLARGDYVLDGVEGKYQRVVKAASGRGARAVSDDEVADVESAPDETAFLFKSSDFAGGYSAEVLFAAFPGTVTDGLPHDEDTVSKINVVIKMRDLINRIALSQGADVTDAEIDNVTAGLSDIEVIRFNRTGLASIYPDICPPFFNPDSGFVEAVPLASVIIGNDGEADTASETSSRAASASAYNTEKSAINSKFSAYSVVFSKSYSGSPTNSSITLKTPPTLKVGVKGTFNNTWGNISGGLSAVVYLAMEAEAGFTQSASYSKNLLPGLYYYRSVYVPAGPVPLFVTVDTGLELLLEAQTTVESNLCVYYTGMYGGTANVGINYGVSWEKIWFISIPYPYFSPYANGSRISETAYFVGGNTTTTGMLALTPTVYGSIGLSMAGVVGIDLGSEAALQAKMTVTVARNSTTGTSAIRGIGSITLYPSVDIEPWVGFSLPHIGRRDFSWRLNLYKGTVPLKTWEIF